ncbi:hypothetical protein [Diaphorobacter nitroreducens]
MTQGHDVVQVRLTALRWALGQWLLAIWDPDLMNFVREPKRQRQRRMFYRAKGVVLHDRALNGGFDA